MKVLRKTRSLCPECLVHLDATIFEEDNKVFISKECPTHGEFKELYWGDYKMYEKASRFAAEGKGIGNPNTESKEKCPKNCGLCSDHKSHSALANIVVTNRCDLNCWYCFFYAGKAGYVYEPTMQQLREMVKNQIEKGKPGGGYIACTAHNIQPDTPTDNIKALFEAYQEYGKY